MRGPSFPLGWGPGLLLRQEDMEWLLSRGHKVSVIDTSVAGKGIRLWRAVWQATAHSER